MRLNPDCIRDLILWIEENVNNRPKVITLTDFQDSITFKKYDYETLLYHFRYISADNYTTNMKFMDDGGMMVISSLTPKGHEFAESIHNESNWAKIKEGANKVGSFSLETLQTIATNVISNALSNLMKP